MDFNGDTWIMRICIVGFNGNIMKIEWNHVCDLLGAAVYFYCYKLWHLKIVGV